MFEYHGWAVVHSTSGRRVFDEAGLHQPDDELLLDLLERQISTLAEPAREGVRLLRTINGFCTLVVAGMRNHRDQSIYELFQWLADNGRRSYGLLFTSDDEDDDRQYNHQTQFRVHRLATGEFTELSDLAEFPAVPPLPPPEWRAQ